MPEEQPPSPPRETRQRPRLLTSLVWPPVNVTIWVHFAAMWIYLLLVQSYQPQAHRGYITIGVVLFAVAGQQASYLLWQRAGPRIATPIELTWAAIIAAAVLTSPSTWSARQESVGLFLGTLAAILAMRLFLGGMFLLLVRLASWLKLS